jgi:hypothetical protein
MSQPTLQQKIDTINGQETGWMYMFGIPGTCTDAWEYDDWIRYIGDKWYPRQSNVNET